MSLTDENILQQDDNHKEDIEGDDEYMEDVVDSQEFIDPNDADDPDAAVDTIEQEETIDALVNDDTSKLDEIRKVRKEVDQKYPTVSID